MKINIMILYLSFFVLPLFADPFEKESGADLHIENLRCEYLVNPSGIDVVKPRLSWYSTSNQRNQKQTAYRILVASSMEKLDLNEGDLWDSQKVLSDKSINIIYNGTELHSEDVCFWKVKVWDKNGDESEWSKTAKWSMGLLNKTDWKGYWIGLDSLVGNDKQFSLSARYLRKEFAATKKIERATAYICGLGLFELYINGNKIGDQVLAPALSEYQKRSYYMTFDVKKEIQDGNNTVGVILGAGRFFAPVKWDQNYGFPKMNFQLNIEYSDGSTQSIVSDTTWSLTTDGPIIINNEFDGEKYDARKEISGWNKIDFDDHKWLKANKVSNPSEILSAQMINPIRIKEIVKPKTIEEIKPGVYIYDMGQNMVGWVSLKVNTDEGTRIKLRFAERINSEGGLDTANLRLAKQTDVYISKGSKDEEWEPTFTYHGFRYVELTGYENKADLNTIIGKVIYDDINTTGNFNCSSDIINKIYNAAYWGIRGNYRSVPTDCPQRDERQAWLGDRSIGSLGESFIFDNNAIYSKWMTDISDGQKKEGSISDVNPTYRKVYSDNVTWPSSFFIIPDYLYQQFDNIDVIVEHYDAMKKWIFYMKDNYIKDYLLPKDSYGDWCMVSEDRDIIHSKDPKTITPGDYLGSAYFYYDLTLMKNYAYLLNKAEDEKEFLFLVDKMRDAINKTYLNKDSLYYSNNTVTANIVGLAFNISPDNLKEKIFDNIVNKVVKENNYHTSCGAIGQQWLMRTLTNNGRPDLALKIAENTTYPSLGYMIENGATTIWELWNGNTAPPKMNSGNHVMLLGDFIAWLYNDVAGIAADPGNPGYKNIIMKPYPVDDMKFAEASYLSMYGLVKSKWQTEENKFHWNIEIPFNTTATIYIPAHKKFDVTVDGDDLSKNKDIKFLRFEDNRAVYQIGSGSYHFVSEIK